MEQPIRILCFSFPASGLNIADVGITGGDRRFIEVAKRFVKMGVRLDILITDTGTAIYQREGFKDANLYLVKPPRFLDWVNRGSIASQNFHVLVSYLLSSFICIFKIPSLPKHNIVYSQSDFLCDTILAFFCRTVLRMKWAAITYQNIPKPFQREGNLIMNMLSFISQQISYNLFRRADLIMVNHTQEGRIVKQILISKGVKAEKITMVSLGVDLDYISKIATNGTREYDACFVAALGPVRGLFDIVPVWSRVTKFKKQAKIVVIGKGTSDYEDEFKKQVQASGLYDNIEIAGYLTGGQLFEKMKKSKVFLALNHEGSWGLAITEGMAIGLPIIAYDLEFYDIYTGGMIKVPFLDFDAVAKAVIRLMENEGERAKLASEAQQTASKFDISRVSKNELNLLNKLVVQSS